MIKKPSTGRPLAAGRSADGPLAGCETDSRAAAPCGEREGRTWPIVENDRDRRGLAWIRTQVDDAAITAACVGLPGNRRAYVTNIARALGLVLPAETARTPREAALTHLARIKALSRKGRRS
jgi:hypothetical protein